MTRTLAELAAGASASAPEPRGTAPYTPVYTKPFAAVDQSLTKTACVLFQDGIPVRTAMLTPEAHDQIARGHEESLQKAEDLARRFWSWLNDCYPSPTIVVHEMPPAGGRMSRPESSLLAALAVRHGWWRYRAFSSQPAEVARMEAAQRAKKRWTGNGNATKAQVKNAVLGLLPASVADLRPLNQDVADAIAIGMVFAEKGA